MIELPIRLDEEDEGFEVLVPSTTGPGHWINIGHDARALIVLRRILRARAASHDLRDLTLGTDAQPVQSMVDDWLRNNTVTTKAKVDLPDDIADIDIDLSSLI